MKIAIQCGQCLGDLTESELAALTEPPRMAGEIEEGGIVRAQCARDHKSTFVLLDPLFDLMFELAALALLDGYYREAVLGVTTALERFYEFCVRAVVQRHGVGPDDYASSWRFLKLSERQLGAFLICYLLDAKEPYDLRPIDAFKKLRNDVAHEGYLPSRDEAVRYAAEAMSEIHRVLSKLFPPSGSDPLQHDLSTIIGQVTAERRARLGGEHAISLGRTTILNSGSPAMWGNRVFEGCLEHLRLTRSFLYAKEAP